MQSIRTEKEEEEIFSDLGQFTKETWTYSFEECQL